MQKTLVITGGAGFVGINLAHAALRRGYEVCLYDIADRLWRLKSTGILRSENVTFHNVDLAVDGLGDFDPPRFSPIIHLAALPHVDYSRFEPQQTITNNINSLINVLEIAKSKGVPVLFSSSVEVYGGKDDTIYQEKANLYPISPYAASKASCEAIISSYQETFGLRTTIVRFSNLYGPWQTPDRLIPRLITQLLSDNECEVEAEIFRDFIYIDDACDAILKIIEADVWGNTFNLSSGISSSNVTVAMTLRSLLGKSARIKIVSPKSNDGRGKFLITSPKRLQQEIEWVPTISLGEGIELTYNWYKENREWWGRFERNIKASRINPEFIVDYSFPLKKTDLSGKKSIFDTQN